MTSGTVRVMGIDVGTKTLGIAMSDAVGLTAQALTTVRRTGLRRDLEQLQALVREWGVDEIVVGLPRRTDGSFGPEAARVLRFTQRLKDELHLPVSTWDERFSTVIAERTLIEGDVRRRDRRTVIDQVAAAVFLQEYLDRKEQDTLVDRDLER